MPAPHDAILQVVITPGETSTSNNFSVVQDQLIYLVQPLQLGGPIGMQANMAAQYFPLLLANVQPPVFQPPPVYTGSSQILDYSWHLSVVNAGQPRGPGEPDGFVQLTWPRRLKNWRGKPVWKTRSGRWPAAPRRS